MNTETCYTLLLMEFPQSTPRPKKVFTWINYIHISLKLLHLPPAYMLLFPSAIILFTQIFIMTTTSAKSLLA
jgi:hypothetical protein